MTSLDKSDFWQSEAKKKINLKMIDGVQWAANTEYLLLELPTCYNNGRKGIERTRARWLPNTWGVYSLDVETVWTQNTALNDT